MTHLVLGATGLQGGAVVDALLDRGASVRALTRNPTGAKTRVLTARGVDVVGGDLSDADSLVPAFTDMESVFSVQDFYAPGVGLAGEIRQGRNVIAAVKAAGVPHLVQSSMGDGNAVGGPAHFLSKATLERDIRRSGLSWTLLGTVWFMDNLLNPAMKPHLMFPVLAGSLNETTTFQMLAIKDLGRVAAEAMMNPGDWSRRKVNLAGDAMTVSEMKRIYLRVTGRRPKSWRIPAGMFRRLVPEFAEQLAWHNKVNFAFGPEELRRERVDAVTFERFLHSIPDPRM